MSSAIARHRAALREATIAALRAELAAASPPGAERIILFGSVARGDFDGASDADLLVIAEGLPRNLPRTVLDRPVEPLVWTRAQWRDALAAGNPFAAEVARDGVELWRAVA